MVAIAPTSDQPRFLLPLNRGGPGWIRTTDLRVLSWGRERRLVVDSRRLRAFRPVPHPFACGWLWMARCPSVAHLLRRYARAMSQAPRTWCARSTSGSMQANGTRRPTIGITTSGEGSAGRGIFRSGRSPRSRRTAGLIPDRGEPMPRGSLGERLGLPDAGRDAALDAGAERLEPLVRRPVSVGRQPAHTVRIAREVHRVRRGSEVG